MKYLCERINFIHRKKFFVLIVLFLWNCSFTLWAYDWTVRTDRHGEPAGTFTTTPFPITESSTSYTVMNDEFPGGRTFTLGTKYYVDGGYTGGSNDGSWSHPWTTIATAVSNVASGNNTIIVRGAHDAFDGGYDLSATISLYGRSGADSLHRYTIVGYGQERPQINGNGNQSFARSDDTDAFITIQRFKIDAGQGSYCINFNSLGSGVSRDRNIYLIDLETTNSLYSTMYFMGNIDDSWISHCYAHNSHGHGIKVGDGASRNIVEWCVVDSMGMEEFGIGSNAECGIDFPANDVAYEDCHSNICRYNIISHVFAYAIQIRDQRDFDCHHNEIYECGYQVRAATGGVLSTTHHINILIYRSISQGAVHDNIIRDDATDQGGAEGSGIYIAAIGVGYSSGSGTIDVYNNLIYGMSRYCINPSNSNTRTVNIYNNSLYQNSSNQLIYLNSSQNSEPDIENNIVYQAGSGNCVAYDAGTTNDYNLYYYPNGSLDPNANGAHDQIPASQDFWIEVPNGAYSATECALTSDGLATDNGTNLSSIFTNSFNGVTRTGVWDIGAYEYTISNIYFNNDIPKQFKLFQNYPNPFNSETTIKFNIAKTSYVSLIVYDILGREIINLIDEKLTPAEYSITFNCDDLAAGIYLYKLTTNTYSSFKKMIVIK
jgi:hypothetical protein